MNKEKLKQTKELELLKICTQDAKFLIEIRKIPIEFYSKKHKSIFEKLYMLEVVDETQVNWAILKQDERIFSEIVGLSYIVPNLNFRIREFFDVHESIIAEKFLIDELNKAKTSYLGTDLLFDLRETVEKELENYRVFDVVKSLAESKDEIINTINTKLDVVNCYYPTMTKLTGGLRFGNYIAIAASHKVGKTTFAISLVRELSKKYPSLIVSLEMRKQDLSEILLASESKVDYVKIRDRELDYNDLDKLKKAKAPEKLYLIDSVYTIDEIEGAIIRMIKEKSIKIILVDYLGLIRLKTKNSREERISEISSRLRTLANKYGVILFIISQLNRAGITEAKNENMAESLALNRDCDFLFLLERKQNVLVNGESVFLADDEAKVELTLARFNGHNQGKSFIVKKFSDNRVEEKYSDEKIHTNEKLWWKEN